MTEAYMSGNVDNVSMITGGSFRARGRGRGPLQVQQAVRQVDVDAARVLVQTDDQRVHERHEHAPAPVGGRDAQQELPGILHHRLHDAHEARARVVHFEAFQAVGLGGQRAFGQIGAAHEAAAPHQQLGDVDGVDAFERHEEGVSARVLHGQHARTARRIVPRRHKGHLHALFQQKRKTRRAARDEPSCQGLRFR